MRLLLVALLLPLVVAADGAAPAPAQPARPAQQRPIPADLEVVRDVVFGKGGERNLKLDIVRPKATATAPMPVVVFVHGGGWEAGIKDSAVPMLFPLAHKGFFCVTVEYRLVPEAPWPAQIEDCKCAVRFLRAKAAEYNIDPQRIGAWGASAGGHLVAMLGTAGGAKEMEGKGGWADQSSRVQAVCDWFGPGPDLAERARKASPITYISSDTPPFLIMHGDQDTLVPIKQSEILRDALEKAKVEVKLEVVKGAGHGFSGVSGTDLAKPVVDFFDSHLAAKPPATGTGTEQAPVAPAAPLR
jgi:acetyl esterase/lipase